MSDLTTMRALIKSELHINSLYIDAAIADAIQFCRTEHLKFNGASATISLETDVSRYALPADFLSLRGDVFYTPPETESIYRYKLKGATVGQVEEYLYTIPSDVSADFSSDFSYIYAIEPYSDDGSHILLAPIPSSSDGTIYFRYTKDIGTPRYTASVATTSPPTLSTVVTLADENGNTLSSNFTNAWFRDGAKAIRARAMYILWSTYHGGTEEASIKAQQSLLLWNEEMNKLKTESSINAIPKQMRRYI